MREHAAAIFEVDDTAALQYLDTRRRSDYFEPEEALLIALLDDAIQTYQKYRGAQDRIGKRLFHDAEAWITTRDDDWIFAFDSVCELLNLNPDFVRRQVLDTSHDGSTANVTARRVRRPRAA